MTLFLRKPKAKLKLISEKRLRILEKTGGRRACSRNYRVDYTRQLMSSPRFWVYVFESISHLKSHYVRNSPHVLEGAHYAKCAGFMLYSGPR